MVFLSASIPNPTRDRKYWDSADLVAIRDAVRALATVIIPKSRLAWGGHPAITPLIRYVMGNMNVTVQDRVVLYQSLYFGGDFPQDNEFFERRVYTAARDNREESLRHMRHLMFSEYKYVAGVFIGGMDGVEKECKMFKEYHPDAKIFPIASTGAAARILYEQENNKNERLLNEYAYMALFRSLFTGLIKL